ncbi:MAG: hypothetical protein OHK003_15100 [Anaerolineales bacterium]
MAFAVLLSFITFISLTGKPWKGFLLHCMINAFSTPLLVNNFIKVNGTMGVIFAPTHEGIFVSIFYGLTGWILYKYRMKIVTDA